MKSNIFYFNPTCEMAIANGTVSWLPNMLLQQFETDIELLVAFLAARNDVVLMRKLPSKKHIQQLEDVGIKLPILLLYNEAIADINFLSQPRNELRPWGWSPVMHRLFKPLFENCSNEFKTSAHAQWNPVLKELTGRKTAQKILKVIVDKKINGVISEYAVPEICTSVNEVIEYHKRQEKIVVKAPWSSSGRGVHIIDSSSIDPYTLARCSGFLKSQNYLMLEPLHDKIFDFSFQFKVLRSKVEYVGINWFYNNDKGGFRGNYINEKTARIPTHLKNILNDVKPKLILSLKQELEDKLLGKYEGIAGVDAMFVKSKNGRIVIHPCLEINLRYNMGNIAASFSQFIVKGYSVFEISSNEEFNALDSKKILLTEGKKFCAYLR